MADDLFHRPAPELVSDEVLTAMERDGWTPTQVRALIASYRLLVRDCLELREELGIVGHGFIKPDRWAKKQRKHAFNVVEKELRKRGVVHISLSDDGASLIEQRREGGHLDLGSNQSLLSAVDAFPEREEVVDG